MHDRVRSGEGEPGNEASVLNSIASQTLFYWDLLGISSGVVPANVYTNKICTLSSIFTSCTCMWLTNAFHTVCRWSWWHCLKEVLWTLCLTMSVGRSWRASRQTWWRHSTMHKVSKACFCLAVLSPQHQEWCAFHSPAIGCVCVCLSWTPQQ
jgi:hypothetical protein